MDRLIAHHTLLADLVTFGFKLWLDQRHKQPVGPDEVERHVEHLGERDEAGIADDDIDGVGDVHLGEDARTGLFVDDDAIILSELPGELIGTRIDRVNAGGTAAEQDIGEPAGG